MEKQILFTLILIALKTAIFAQKKPNDDFAVFWKKFKTALVKNDKKSISEFINYPFEYTFANDYKKALNAEELIKVYDKLFNNKVRRYLINHKPVKEDKNTFSIICYGDLDYHFKNEYGIRYNFEKNNEEWKLTYILKEEW